MSNKPIKKQVDQHSDNHDDLNLKGTFFMVMSLGILMILSWFGVFMLFMDRL